VLLEVIWGGVSIVITHLSSPTLVQNCPCAAEAHARERKDDVCNDGEKRKTDVELLCGHDSDDEERTPPEAMKLRSEKEFISHPIKALLSTGEACRQKRLSRHYPVSQSREFESCSEYSYDYS
jgi:hypothetical protein